MKQAGGWQSGDRTRRSTNITTQRGFPKRGEIRFDRRTAGWVKNCVMNATITPRFSLRVLRLLWLIFAVALGCFFIPSLSARRLESPNTIQSFRVGFCPNDLAFDGANIWTSNECDDTATK